MVTIVKTLLIGIRAQYSKDLDYGLKDLGIEPITTDFYETEICGKEVSRYYVKVQCDSKEEERLLNWLNNDFNHDVTINY